MGAGPDSDAADDNDNRRALNHHGIVVAVVPPGGSGGGGGGSGSSSSTLLGRCCCCCCLRSDLAPLTAVPTWAALLLAYLGWAGCGFLFGFHWLVVVFCAARGRHDRLWGLVYMLCMLVAAAAVAGGGTYCRESSVPCPNGTDMSHACLFSVQPPTYRHVYIFHFVGLAWLFTAWLVDGLQLWHWVCCSRRKPSKGEDDRGRCGGDGGGDGGDGTSTPTGDGSDVLTCVGPAGRPGQLTLLFSAQPLAGPAYVCVLVLITTLVTLTWTLIVTDWTTDAVPAGSATATSLATLGGFLVLEIVCCTFVASGVLNLMRAC